MPRRTTANAHADETPPATSAGKTEEPTTRDVRIVVVAEDGGAPIEGAAVHIDEIETFEDRFMGAVDATTGAAGVATVTIEREPTSYLCVGKRGHLVSRTTMDRNTAEIRVTLAAGTPLAGRVVLADTRAPVEGVAVRAWDSGKLTGQNDEAELDVVRVTDAEGRFELAGVPVGRQIMIIAAKTGFRSQILTTTDAASGPEVEMLLGDGGVMFGTVYGEDGRPLPGVEVLQMPVSMDLPDRVNPGEHESFARNTYTTFLFPPVVTDAVGRYEFRGVRLPINGLPQPRLAVARKADGHVARGEPATFTQQGERQQRDVRFAKAPSITVRVKTSSPLPTGTEVRAQGNGPGTRDAKAALPADGAPVVLEGLTANLYFVSVSAGDGFSEAWSLQKQITVADGEDATVEFVIDEDARIAGRVVDEEGRGMGGQVVEFNAWSPQSRDSVRSTVSADFDGSFAFERLLPMTGVLRIHQQEHNFRSGPDGYRPIAFETVELPDVRPGGPPLFVRLRRLGKLVLKLSPAPDERSLVVQAVSGRLEGHSRLTIGGDGGCECDAPLVGVPMRMWIALRGFAPVVLDVPAVASGETRDLGEISLAPGLVLDGKLVDAEGNPVAGAEVRTLERWMHQQQPSTGSDGRFKIDRIPRRPLVLRVRAQPPAPVTIFVVADPSVSPATFTIGAGALIEGRVLDARGEPVSGAHVTWFPGADLTDEEDAFSWTEADAAGRYSFRLQAGHGRVYVYDPKGRVACEKIDVTVADGEKRTVDLRLP